MDSATFPVFLVKDLLLRFYSSYVAGYVSALSSFRGSVDTPPLNELGYRGSLRFWSRARLRLWPLLRWLWLLRTISHRRICHRRSRSRIVILVRRRWRQLFLDRLAREHLVALRRHINK